MKMSLVFVGALVSNSKLRRTVMQQSRCELRVTVHCDVEFLSTSLPCRSSSSDVEEMAPEL